MEFRTLALRGEGGYRQYRIPALAVTPSGRIVAIYDGRPDLDDLPGPIDVILLTSDDNGTTWSEPIVLRKSEDIAGSGDASIVIDPSVGECGRILVFVQSSKLAGFFESGLGTDPDDPTVVHIEISSSDDDGRTWTHRNVTAQLKDDCTPGIFATSGMGGRVVAGPFAGRLLQTFVLRRQGEVLARVGYSDDHGDTWVLGAEIPGGNESAAVGLQDGTVLVHSRATPFRLSGISLDGGQTLASLAPDPALPDPSDNGSLCVLSDGSVLSTHNHDSDLRRRTVVKRSTDGGRTWPETAVLEAGSSAYSTACELQDGSIGVLFERNGYVEMVFARLQLSDFGPTERVLPLEVDADGIEFTTVLRYVRPARIAAPPALPDVASQRLIPEADTSVWEVFAIKEVAHPGATSEPIYTAEEFEVMLGPARPGLHPGDEMRFSGRLGNHSMGELTDVVVRSSNGAAIERESLPAGERLVFLDVRRIVNPEDVQQGLVSMGFTWSAALHLPGVDEPRPVGGAVVQRYSVATGLPLVG